MYCIVRIRGGINAKPKIRHTLESLNLTRTNHCVIFPENETTKGMLNVVKDYVTWGEIDSEALSELIESRGTTATGDKVTKEALKELGFGSMNELSEAIISGEYPLRQGLKPVFRLHPPRKGYEGIKNPYITGGALGYRGDQITALLRRMI